ncbi:hypothetical protein [Pedobacter nyackensis]|uniref:hypothetical protein n=1 Tax=Pedobacter nyackensis TaxID=475255 RepID=UPI00293118C7|nr:hypothetical protein [Pedobacter nyackensis]
MCLSACIKEHIEIPASINVVNVAINAGIVKVNYFGKSINWGSYTGTEASVVYGANKVYSVVDARSEFSLNIVRSTDTTKSVFNGHLNLTAGSINSLYLTGQSPNYDTVFVKESAFPVYADSAFAVRFINLVPNSGDVNVTLASSSTVNEFTGLAYKKQSVFKKYEATYKFPNTYFNFQVRNSNGILLASHTISSANHMATRRKRATLVFRGLIGGTGTNSPAISFVPNY